MLASPLPHGRTANRLTWPFLPPDLRAAIEARLGGAVVDAVSQDAGFTPGFASILSTDTTSVFLKAASRKAQRPIAAAYAVEARTRHVLGDRVPAPRLLWTLDDPAQDGWVVSCFERYDGAMPTRPWERDALDQALDLAERIATADMPAELALAPLVAEMPELASSWATVAAIFPERDHLDEAGALARAFGSIPAPALQHGDLRSDNVLIGGSGAVACDWNWPALGPAWLDTVDLLISAHGDGLDADALLAARPLTRAVDPDAIDSWLAAYCGVMTVAATRPGRSSSPYLPRHAQWCAEASWRWLAARRGWS